MEGQPGFKIINQMGLHRMDFLINALAEIFVAVHRPDAFQRDFIYLIFLFFRQISVMRICHSGIHLIRY